MSKGELVKFEESIRDRIYSIRGYQVMLDSDLAELYNVGTKVLNQAVKRNIDRFPSEFCFSLNNNEMRSLRSQIVTSNKANNSLRSQFIISDRGGRRYLPIVFTEQGVAMLAGVQKSEVAVKISIQIIKAFIEMRKFIQSNAQVFQRLDRVELKQLDIKKFESQYSPIEVKVLKNIHDRFIIIDGEVLYFFGASLKDLGKKLFGFMKMGKVVLKKMEKIGKI